MFVKIVPATKGGRVLHGGRAQMVVRLATLIVFVRGRLEAYFRFLVMLRSVTGNERTFVGLVANLFIFLGGRTQIVIPRFIELAPVILIHRLCPMGRNGIIGGAGRRFRLRLLSRLFIRPREIGANGLVGNVCRGRSGMNRFRRIIKLFRLVFVVALRLIGNGFDVPGLFLFGRFFVNRLRLCRLGGCGLFIDRLVPFLFPLGLFHRFGGAGLVCVGSILLVVGCRRLFGCRGDSVIILKRGKRLGIFAVDLGNGGVQLGDLPAQQFFRRTWLHILELAHNRTARLVVNLRPVFGSIVRQAIHGLANDCYKIRHKHFLVVTGDVPARYGL